MGRPPTDPPSSGLSPDLTWVRWPARRVRNGQYGPVKCALLVARCKVLDMGRLTARLPEAVRLLMSKADGSFLVHDDAGGLQTFEQDSEEIPPVRKGPICVQSVLRDLTL